MADTKHTPGPWEPMETGAFEGLVSGIIVSAGTKAANEFVACVLDGGGDSEEITAANARLIAAAPDLLAAAEAAYPMLRAHVESGCTGCPDAEAARLVREALKKAGRLP